MSWLLRVVASLIARPSVPFLAAADYPKTGVLGKKEPLCPLGELGNRGVGGVRR